MSGWSRATVGGSGNQAKGANIVQEQRPPSRIMEKRGIGGKRIAKKPNSDGFSLSNSTFHKILVPQSLFSIFSQEKNYLNGPKCS
jgi:hypothetical protein